MLQCIKLTLTQVNESIDVMWIQASSFFRWFEGRNHDHVASSCSYWTYADDYAPSLLRNFDITKIKSTSIRHKYGILWYRQEASSTWSLIYRFDKIRPGSLSRLRLFFSFFRSRASDILFRLEKRSQLTPPSLKKRRVDLLVKKFNSNILKKYFSLGPREHSPQILWP